MSVYRGFIKTETKKWTRDSLTAFMIFYPLLFGVVGRWVVPWIERSADMNLEPFYYIILAGITLVAPHIYGALIAFSIIDDREDHIFTSIMVTPLPLFQFLSFRLMMGFVLAFSASIFIILFSNLVSIGIGYVLLLSFLSALIAPIVTLLINSLAKNKIEGFAMMKAVVGVLMIFTVASLFFHDAVEWFFAFVPGFWPAKAMSSLILAEGSLNMGFHGYYWIGLVYLVGCFLAVYQVFMRKGLK
ncbi:ABC transporter permease [Salipaludibacillus keqinensis]|uniref:ABC transporter permease n=1 Tax=Salipaludibacillus keqinensis TaxID=2045207 RepID=A0A323TA58_9BACI|nr:ABC transporter permease [Salipaludibacillus keqinensis]PYZ92301.1 ABC transporter permease [Salipaludibacillus keqinensis]